LIDIERQRAKAIDHRIDKISVGNNSAGKCDSLIYVGRRGFVGRQGSRRGEPDEYGQKASSHHCQMSAFAPRKCHALWWVATPGRHAPRVGVLRDDSISRFWQPVDDGVLIFRPAQFSRS
jgi:hypothetical protein